jgi:DNA-binding response OmpR family regulator
MTANPLVLVVDDDQPVARMVASTLTLEGFDVSVAHDGKEALSSINARAPDAIVLDLQMPIMDGRECFRRLREQRINTPVVILSAYGAEAAQQELGAEGFVDKPFDPDQLVIVVRGILDSEQPS